MLADGSRHVVVFFFMTERTCHAAAAGVYLPDSVTEKCPEDAHCILGADQCFLMAVGVIKNCGRQYAGCGAIRSFVASGIEGS